MGGTTLPRSQRHLILSCLSYLFLATAREQLREKNPELTVRQVHTAVSSLVSSWWLSGRAPAKLIEHTASTIQTSQQRNAQARKSHVKSERKKLLKMGIYLRLFSEFSG